MPPWGILGYSVPADSSLFNTPVRILEIVVELLFLGSCHCLRTKNVIETCMRRTPFLNILGGLDSLYNMEP